MNIVQKICHNKLLRNGSLFSLYSFLQSGISFILLIVLAKFISPADYGSMSLFNTASTLFGYFVGLNTAGYLSVSFFANKQKEEFKKDSHHWLLLHGRYCCKAAKPDCSHCPILDLCEFKKKNLPPQ